MNTNQETLYPAEESYGLPVEGLSQVDRRDLETLYSPDNPLTMLDVLGVPRDELNIPDTVGGLTACVTTRTGGEIS